MHAQRSSSGTNILQAGNGFYTGCQSRCKFIDHNNDFRHLLPNLIELLDAGNLARSKNLFSFFKLPRHKIPELDLLRSF
jgi:hypothetical protein